MLDASGIRVLTQQERRAASRAARRVALLNMFWYSYANSLGLSHCKRSGASEAARRAR